MMPLMAKQTKTVAWRWGNCGTADVVGLQIPSKHFQKRGDDGNSSPGEQVSRASFRITKEGSGSVGSGGVPRKGRYPSNKVQH